MKIDSTYLVHIKGDLYIKDGCSDELIKTAIDRVPTEIAKLINSELPRELVATCKEVNNEQH